MEKPWAIWKLKVEAHSPWLLHGAKPSKLDTAFYSLRPSALKGLIRFWWRALKGATLDIKELFQEESELFGSAETEDKNGNPQQSLIWFKVRDGGTDVNEYPILAHSKDGNKIRKVDAIEIGNQWQVDLYFKKTIFTRDYKSVLYALELVNAFGALGQRANRGFGSVGLSSESWEGIPTEAEKYFTKIKDSFKKLKDCTMTGSSELERYLKDLFFDEEPEKDPSPFPIFKQGCFFIGKVHFFSGKDFEKVLRSMPHLVSKLEPWNGWTSPTRQASSYRIKIYQGINGYWVVPYLFRHCLEKPLKNTHQKVFEHIEKCFKEGSEK